ncbi:MAG: hypothetical protein R6V72_21235 [Cyclobacterium sp.]|uniref:hypothetical protein n=1 Tax=unclassified Cyclobacterium TaxID=2615055 RepID=UPI0013D08314|nr:hypothetical protein [Cyclobacterium sp. SYSU L10401]
MIRDQLIPALKEKYGDTFTVGEPNEFIALFPAKHEKVGRLMLYEGEEYLTFVIEKVAHDHVYFDPNEEQEKIDQSVTTQTMEFLDDLFNDRILMGLAKDLMGTSIMALKWGEPKDFMQPGFDYFLWSGPIGDITENSQK